MNNIFKWFARSLLVGFPLLTGSVNCQLADENYTMLMLLTSIVAGCSLYLLISSAEKHKGNLASENWQSARSAQEQIKESLRRRGLGGNSVSIFDGKESLSQALSSGFSLLITFALSSVLTAGRTFSSTENCDSFNIKHSGFVCIEIISWIVFFTACMFAFQNRRNK